MMDRHPTTPWIVPLLLLSLACGAQPGDRAPGEAYNLAAWHLEPELRIGSETDPRIAFSHIIDLELGSTSELYLTQFGVPYVTVLDESGRFLRTIGRRGQGPGEFIAPMPLGWLGDCLWVLDPPQRRVAFFDAAGNRVDEFGFLAPPPVHEGVPYLPLRPHSILADGTALVQASVGALAASRARITQVPVLRISRDEEVLDTLAVIPFRSPAVVIRFSSRAGTTSRRHPLPDEPIVRTTPSGASIVVLDRTAARQPDSAAFRVLRLGIAGDTIYDRRISYVPRPVAPVARDSILDEIAARQAEFYELSFGAARRDVGAAFDGELPDFYPPVRQVAVASDAEVWLEMDTADGYRGNWLLLSAAGDPIALVRRPADRPRLLRITATHAWGTVEDEFDVPSIIRYRISRGG